MLQNPESFQITYWHVLEPWVNEDKPLKAVDGKKFQGINEWNWNKQTKKQKNQYKELVKQRKGSLNTKEDWQSLSHINQKRMKTNNNIRDEKVCNWYQWH